MGTVRNANAGSGSIVNEILRELNSLGMTTKESQEHAGAKDANSLYVGYTFDDTAASGVFTKDMRPKSVRLPNGRIVHCTYGSTGSIADRLARLDAIQDDLDAYRLHLKPRVAAAGNTHRAGCSFAFIQESTMRVLHRAVVAMVPCVALAAWLPLPAIAGESLRWKFAAGETIGYSIEQTADLTINANGAEFNMPTNQVIDVTWTVKAVAEDGTGDIGLHVDRVRLSFTAPSGGGAPAKFAYDSQEGKDAEGPLAARLMPVLKALVGSDFTMKIAPTGLISDVAIPENVAKAIATVPRGVAFGGGNLLTEDGLRQTLENSVLLLPAEEVNEGGTWQRQLERALPGAGSLVFDLTHTLEGADKLCDRDTRRIATVANVTHKPAADAGTQVKLDTVEGKGSGTAHFDPEAGRTVLSVLKVSLLVDGIFAQNEFTQETDLTITITLAGCMPPAQSAPEKPAENP